MLSRKIITPSCKRKQQLQIPCVYYSKKVTGKVVSHAQEIVNILKKDEGVQFRNDCFYLTSEEPDILSQKLIENGVSSLHHLLWQYNHKSKWREIKISSFNDDGTQLISLKGSQHFESLKKYDWEIEPPVRIISIMTCQGMAFKLLPTVLQHLDLKTGIYSCGRIPIYAIVPALEYKLLCEPNEMLTAQKATTPPRCFIYSMLFDRKPLGKIPQGAIQMNQVNKKYKVNRMNISWSDMYMVKLMPKKDLYKNVASVGDLKPMISSFVHLYKRPTQRLIPNLEKILPGVGESLIYSGITMNNTFMNVDLFKYPNFYKLLKSHPNYEGSSFSVMFPSSLTNTDQEHLEDDMNIQPEHYV